MALAFVMVEENTRRAVHLRDDDAFGAVDDERAVHRHERHVAHVDVLFLDVLDRLRAGLRIDIEHDQAQRDLQRRGIGHAPLPALVNVVLRRFENVFDELEQRDAGEIGNRKDRAEDRLQPFVQTAAFRLLDHQKLVVGSLLHFDQVRHFRDLADMSEKLPNALSAGEGLR
jgi:hypothetical protein